MIVSLLGIAPVIVNNSAMASASSMEASATCGFTLITVMFGFRVVVGVDVNNYDGWV